MKILIMNGPNLDMLGKRDERVYGSFTLDELDAYIVAHCAKKGVGCEFYQSSYEGGLIDKLHSTDADGIVLNAGAYTHYSYALRDAIDCTRVPVIEVHISDISAREGWRRVSVIGEVCAATFMGMGKDSYIAAVDRLCEITAKGRG